MQYNDLGTNDAKQMIIYVFTNSTKL